MTSELKCPFCQKELKHEKTTGIHCCPTIFIDCPLGSGTGAFGTKELWQALIQIKQDLVIATKALEEIRDETGEDRAGFSYIVLAMNMKETAENALKQIEHKGSE